jgi:uncharacterized spore protein YtfJ
MEEGMKLFREAIPSQEAGVELMERLYEAAQPAAVFSQPLQAGEYTVITAAEVGIGLGYGYGGGGGRGPAGDERNTEEATEQGYGIGAGGAGGGGAWSRPVAAIEIGPHGVRVEPIVDPTKIALAFFTTLISMFALMGQMRRMAAQMQRRR